MGKSTKVTIRDVAEAAGVSAMTVSTVLHGAGSNVRVSVETAAKIRSLATELSYQPNTLARSLRSRKTNTVGVVFQHFSRLSEDNPYYPQLLNGVMSALFKEKYTLALCPHLIQGDDLTSIWDGRFDGVLWARPDFTESSLDRLRRSSIPLVMMHAPPGTAEGVSTFTADNDGAMRLVVQHLVSIGHQDMVFIVDEVNEHTAEGRARAAAFTTAVREAGVAGSVFVWDERSRTLENFRTANRGFTAVTCFSDTLAGHLLLACQQLGILIPRDLSVVGFDSSKFCERTIPRLTSIHQRVEQIAFDATSHLLSLIKGGTSVSDRPAPISSLYDCGLDLRDSTSPPSSLKKNI